MTTNDGTAHLIEAERATGARRLVAEAMVFGYGWSAEADDRTAVADAAHVVRARVDADDPAGVRGEGGAGAGRAPVQPSSHDGLAAPKAAA